MKRTLLFFLLVALNVSSYGQVDTLKMYMFGHSLVNYESNTINTDEGKIAHWIYLLAQADNNYFASTGQWGFLPSHSMLPPIAAWGYSQVPSVWDSDNELFSDANFNSTLLTPGNFMQWQPADEDYPTDPGLSPLSATETIFDWVADRANPVKFYLYENWPDLAPYLNNGFPPSFSEFEAYNQYTVSDFHTWWIDYQDFLLSSRPDYNVRLIPAGSVMSKLHTDFFPNSIPLTDLYEDDAPHGTTNTYFLAGLICYMSIFEKPASSDFEVPSSIHPIIRDNFTAMVDFIWQELLQLNLNNGNSRVFCNDVSVSTDEAAFAKKVRIAPNPNKGLFTIITDHQISRIKVFDIYGRLRADKQYFGAYKVNMNLSELGKGIYFLQLNDDGIDGFVTKKIVIR